MVSYSQNSTYLPPLQYPQYPQYAIIITLPLTTSKIISKFPIFTIVSYLYLFSIALTTPLNLGGCISDYRHCVEIVTQKAPRQPPYMLTCRSILLADHCSHFSYLLPHIISTFFVYIQSLQSYLYNEVARSIPTHCKAYTIAIKSSILVIYLQLLIIACQFEILSYTPNPSLIAY